MHRKFKLTLGSLAFLGFNGIALPNLENSLNSLSSLNNFSWGGLSLSFRKTALRDNYQLKIEEKKTHSSTSLIPKKETLATPELKLDNQGKNNFSLQLEPLLDKSPDKDYISSIQTIYSEITREGETIKLRQKTDSQYEASVKQHLEIHERKRENMLAHYNKAKATIETWSRSRTQKPAQPTTQVLSLDQRISLQHFFEFLYDLTTQRKDFSGNLNELSREENKELFEGPKASIPSPQKIKTCLRILGWHQSNFRLVNVDKWDDSNPLKPFYNSQEEINQALKAKKANEQRIQRALQQNENNRSWGWGRHNEHFDRIKQSLQKEQRNTASDIQFHISTKLLEWINQLSK